MQLQLEKNILRPLSPGRYEIFSFCVQRQLKVRMKVDLDYVYRSEASCMSAAVDVCWLTDDEFLVGFQSGLVELIDVHHRKLRGGEELDLPVIGMARVDSDRVIVQTKAGNVTLFEISEPRTSFKKQWSVSSKQSVSFARPAVVASVCLFVQTGQSLLGFIDIETGNLEGTIDLSKSIVCENPGLVVGIVVNEHDFLVLTESGSIVRIDSVSRKILQGNCQTKFPESGAVPTCFSANSVVGFSNGSIVENGNIDRRIFPNTVGVGAIGDDGRIIGGWNGELFGFPDQPHSASIRSISVNESRTRIAVASTDGRVSVWYIDSDEENS